ncbi:hypothetical protein V3C99_000732, partial [Haemonchus contortus]
FFYRKGASMSDDSENGHSRDGIDIRTPSVHIRIEDIGTSSNPIVLDASPIETRPSSEAPRGRGNPSVRSSRRKCPLGAYVEIIDESISPRTQTTVINNPTITTTMSVQRSSNEPADVEVAVDHGMDTTEECGPFLQVPASFEILMRCSICMEIFHNPANVSPCNHKFCHSCLLSWKRTNQTAVCPQCRGPIHSMQKDAQFNEVVQSFLLANPSKRRSPSELESLDAMDTECTEFQNGNQRGRRRGSVPQTRNRSVRDRTVRTPLLVRVSQIRAHRPVQRQRGHRGILEDWFNI